MYADADVYVMDDPLSAVDADVGRHLFDKLVQLRYDILLVSIQNFVNKLEKYTEPYFLQSFNF